MLSGKQVTHDEDSEVRNVLRETLLFKGLNAKELKSFFKKVELRAYRAGSVVFRPGDSPVERLYVLKTGRVERYRLTSGGKRLVTGQILPGGVFGVMGLLGRTMQGNFAETTEDSRVYELTREDVLALLQRKPELALRVLENVGSRVRVLEERLVDAFYSPVMVRLARFLLDNADTQSGTLGDITHEEIGNTIGAVRQTVTETLSIMRERGLVSTGTKEIRVLDRRGLERVTKGYRA